MGRNGEKRGSSPQEDVDACGEKFRGIDFEHVIHDPKAMPFFLDFLSQIEQVEQLFLWLEVEEYKQLTGRTGDLMQQAQKIFDKYFSGLRETSVFEELTTNNNDEDIFNAEDERSTIKQKLEDGMPTLDMFTRAQHCIERELRLRHFPAFRESRSYKALLDELRIRHPLSLTNVLENPSYLEYLTAFLKENNPDKIGNLDFIIELNNSYKLRVTRRPLPKSPEDGRSSNVNIRGSPSLVESVEQGRENCSSPLSPQSQLQRKKQLRGKQSLSSYPMSQRRGAHSPSNSISGYQSEVNSNLTSSYTSTSSMNGQPVGRHSTFIDMLPVSAALPSVTSELSALRLDLLECLHVAYALLDQYLSRSSKSQATTVPDDVRQAVAQDLERISNELGGGSGKLASVSGFASVGTAYSVLETLRQKLASAFLPAQKRVIAWMQEKIFPEFKDTEYFAALMSKIEEDSSEAHQERKLLRQVISGQLYSEKLLVLTIPKKSSELNSRETVSSQIDEEEKRSDSDLSLEQQREQSYLWNATTNQPSITCVAKRAVFMTAKMLVDERPLRVFKLTNDSPCECSCHYKCDRDDCTCTCTEASLSCRVGGLLFRTEISNNDCVRPTDGADSQRSAKGEDASDSEESDDERPSGPSIAANDQESKDEPLPSNLPAYILPTGLNVRTVNQEDLEHETIARLNLNFRTRRLSDPENVNGYLSVPPQPIGQSYTRMNVLSIVNDATDEIPPEQITKAIHEAKQPNDIFEGQHNCQPPNTEEENSLELEAKIKALSPSDSIHCFTMPCVESSRKDKSSKTRFWHGVCYTSYSAVKINCPAINVQESEQSEGIDTKSRSPLWLRRRSSVHLSPDQFRSIGVASEYTEVVVKLTRHPEFGLGLNLTLNLHGFITVTDFVARPDGTRSPAARSGVLMVNDVLVAIDGVSVATQRFESVVRRIKQATQPLEYTFVRGWRDTMNRCAFCGKTVCLPTFVFVPNVLCILGQDEPRFSELRQLVTQCKPMLKGLSSSEEFSANSWTDILDSCARWNEKFYREARARPVGALRLQPPRVPVPFRHLFRFVRKEHVADVLASLLVNRPVIMLSDSPSLLAFVGESLRTLLWPFVWKHKYQPILPIPLARRFCERREKRMAKVMRIVEEFPDDMETQLTSHMLSTFFIGICTLGMSARDTNLGEFAGYDDIKDWMLQEHDNLRPFDRFMAISALAPLLQGGTVVLDIDSDTLEVPRPLPADSTAGMEQHQGVGTPRGVEEMRRSSASRFSHPLFRYEEAAIMSRRMRTSSSTSISSFVGSAQMGIPSFANRSYVPSFPETVRDRLLHDWESIPSEACSFEFIHSKLMRSHSSMLSAYREYYLTFQHEVEGRKDSVIGFNMQMFLLKCPRLYRPYLSSFLRTKSFGSFLIECTNTKSEFFARRSHADRPPLFLRTSSSLSTASGVGVAALGSPVSCASNSNPANLEEIPEHQVEEKNPTATLHDIDVELDQFGENGEVLGDEGVDWV